MYFNFIEDLLKTTLSDSGPLLKYVVYYYYYYWLAAMMEYLAVEKFVSAGKLILSPAISKLKS